MKPHNQYMSNIPQRFHDLVDGKGATIMFVKANSYYIFGGYNPIGWKSEFCYSETPDAYLFSVTDHTDRKPTRCPIKKDKVEFAIKQNNGKYSPAFGEANISDLFISFKNLANSYSKLGNVYKMPKDGGQDGETYLAGRKEDWHVHEVEIW